MNKKTSAEWLEKYYPEPAGALVKRMGQDKVALLEHALRKWRGLRPKTLRQYGLRMSGHYLHAGDTTTLYIGTTTCSLCVAFSSCIDCPLPEIRSGRACDEKIKHGQGLAPYAMFIHGENPEPMIALLLKALRCEKRRKAAKRSTP